jgi:alkanesulfonate monooxygenase SsuD/methylene tetrahydromethanopterin reductase-like flavin-dependent oxidoreductase (luciferase family)
MTSTITVGIGPPLDTMRTQPERAAFAAACAAAGIDHLFMADHVSFRGGHGTDGLIAAASFLSLHQHLRAYVGVYLLALRHPVVVARQLASIAEMAPGRLTFGIGVGGEDRHEFEVCGVDPATRGRRTDEALHVLRRLLTGEQVDHHGEFFTLEDARVLPPPSPPIPMIIGGRSPAALRRTAIAGDGWLAAWCTPAWFAASVASIDAMAEQAGREVVWQHGYQNWIGVGADRAEALVRLGPAMERFYGVPFAAFEPYAPAGTPQEIAEYLAPFVEAGCATFNLFPIAPTPEAGMSAVAEVKQRLMR